MRKAGQLSPHDREEIIGEKFPSAMISLSSEKRCFLFAELCDSDGSDQLAGPVRSIIKAKQAQKIPIGCHHGSMESASF